MASPVLRLTHVVLLVAALGGCVKGDHPVNGTRGELGRVEFTYRRSCFFGCPLEQPLLVGTRELIDLSTPGDADGVGVASSASEVAAFALQHSCYCERSDSTSRLDIRDDADCPGVWRKHCDNQVLVAAAMSGETKLELRDAHGALIDRVSVIVQQAHDARFSAKLPDVLGPKVDSHFDVAAGASFDLALTLFDEEGLELLAPEAVDWHAADVTIATISGFLTGNVADVHGGLSVSVHAVGPGDTKVHVAVPGLDTSVDLHVTD